MTPPRRLDAVYELTVAGRLGPVLRARFRRAPTTACGIHTTLCLRAHDGEDLVDILWLLRSRGLEVTTISAIH